MADTRAFWNEKFAPAHAVYGEAPNDFLREQAALLKSPVLSLGEGEGRNAVFLAGLGLTVTALDASERGLEKAQALATKRGVSVATVHADLETFELGVARWGGVVSLWCHLPKALRARVHASVVRALAPGGVFIAELYTPRQLAFGTGGPKDVNLLCEPDEVRAELAGLSVERCVELERVVEEGTLHHGKSSVLQVIARKIR